MASLRNAPNLPGLVAQTEAVLDGIRSIGLELNIDDMEQPLAEGLQAATEARSLCAAAKAAKAEWEAEMRDAFQALREFTSKGIAIFRVHFGVNWNGQWETLGFSGGHVRQPRTRPGLLDLAQRLQRCLAGNPAWEAPSTGVTAVAGLAVITRFQTARCEVNQCKTNVCMALDSRKAAIKQMRYNLTLFRTRLSIIGRADNRWHLFGYSRPCDPNTPEVPEQVTIAPQTAGSEELVVTWAPARRAERYRIHAQVVDSEDAPVLIESTPLTKAHLKGLIPGARYEITVTAVNKAGESRPGVARIPGNRAGT